MSSSIMNLTELRAVFVRWQAEHDSVADAAISVNLKHLRWVGPAGVLVNALHVLVLGTQLLTETYQGVALAWRTGLLVAHLSMGLALAFLTVASRQLEPAHPTRLGRLLPVGAAAVCLFFAVVIVAIDQWVTPNITPFLVGCVLASLIFYVRPVQSGLLYLAATLAFLFCIGLTQGSPDQLVSNRLNGITIGVLGWILQFVMWRKFATITRQQQQLLQINVKLSQRQAELEYLAHNDVLTGLANRLAANERLETEFVRMQRSDRPYAVLMMDIDLFKDVNDSHGHAAGDQVLQRVANTLHLTLRKSDFAARFGGEEFLALLPATDMPAALQVAEKLRQAVESSPDPVAGRVTLSIGLAMAAPDQANEEVAVRNADHALYRAKRQGRNRVQVAADSPVYFEGDGPGAVKLLQLVWRSTYESGNQTIDYQHRALFADANKLLTAALEGQPVPALITLVDAFTAEVAQHFQDEEALITKAGFSGAAEHALMHRTLLAQASVLSQRFHEGSVSVGELFEYLAHEVVARHILVADREYFASLASADS